MKSIKNLRWGLLALCATFCLILTGCQKPTGSNSGTSDPETPAEDVIVINAGDEITVNVGETVKVKAEGKTAAEFTQEGLTITHKENGVFEITAADTMTDATVSVNFNDGTDADDGIDVTVYVYDPYYHLTLTLDDKLKAKAISISIYAEGKEDSESSASLKQTVDATYTSGEATATAKLAKDKANSYKYFNNIVVTVKDSEGNEIDVETNPVYFCYTDESFTGLSVSEAVAAKTFTINFEGFTIAGGSVTGVKYATEWDDDSNGPAYSSSSAVTPTVTIADNGASASFEVAQTKEFYIDWTAVVVKDSSNNEITISSGNTEAKQWYGYSGDVWSNTLTYVAGEYKNIVTDKAFTADAAYIQVIEAADFEGLTISALKVIAKITSATGDWWASASSAGSWNTDTYQSLVWSDEDSGYSGVITAESFISALADNGLYLNVPSDAVGTVTVSYIAQ